MKCRSYSNRLFFGDQSPVLNVVRIIRAYDIAVQNTAVYRLTVLTPKGGDSTDVAGAKNLGALEGRQFQKIPYASRAFKDEQQDSGCAFHGFF